jgi:tRNA uridine 5-carbamoylmethylation protein Kti12
MKKLLTEFYELCKDGICQDLLTEREKHEVANGAMYLSGRIQTCEKKNGNGRIYPCNVLKREIKKYEEVVKDNRALGELDHPDDSVINLRNVSHLITDVWWEGNDVIGKITILNTPAGKVVKDLVNSGVKLGISSRGMGSVQEQMGASMVQEDFELICFDIVSEPSTPNAFIYPDKKSKNITASIYEKKINENKTEIIGDLFKKILKD